MPTIALLSWPVIALIIATKMPRAQALITLIIVPYLLLPEAFAIPLPGLPDLDKISVISFSLVLAFVATQPRPKDVSQNTHKGENALLRTLVLGCVMLLLISVALTVLGNREPLSFERRYIPGLRAWDAISLLSAVVVVIIPFYFAQRFLTSAATHNMLLRALVLAGLAYSILMLIEVRLSPQLHNWVYGYHQHSFLQHVRSGYRPKVFLGHGIHVGFFTFTALFSAICLWRIEKNSKWVIAACWLAFILLISRNLGALMIASLVLAIFFFFSEKMKRITILFVCVLILAYPAIRNSPISPANLALSVAEVISQQRAESLAFRFRHEVGLLKKANQKPLTGWGGWGRNREIDALGRDISVTDGLWIQRFGVSGWPGYLGFFGLLCFPLMIFAQQSALRKIPAETFAFALIMTGNLIYIIPNNVMSPLAWLFVGAIAGLLYRGKEQEASITESTSQSRQHSAYTRFRSSS